MKRIVVICLIALFVSSISYAKDFKPPASTQELKEGIDYIEKDGIRCDPKDLDPEYKKIMEEVEKEIEKAHSDIRKGMGYCHIYWKEKKRILKEKYGVDWKTPAELNPHIIFD